MSMSWLKALGSVSLYGTVVVRPLKHESNQVDEIMTFSELESRPKQGETSIAELRLQPRLGRILFSPLSWRVTLVGVKSVFVKVR